MGMIVIDIVLVFRDFSSRKRVVKLATIRSWFGEMLVRSL